MRAGPASVMVNRYLERKDAIKKHTGKVTAFMETVYHNLYQPEGFVNLTAPPRKMLNNFFETEDDYSFG